MLIHTVIFGLSSAGGGRIFIFLTIIYELYSPSSILTSHTLTSTCTKSWTFSFVTDKKIFLHIILSQITKDLSIIFVLCIIYLHKKHSNKCPTRRPPKNRALALPSDRDVFALCGICSCCPWKSERVERRGRGNRSVELHSAAVKIFGLENNENVNQKERDEILSDKCLATGII